jgi:trans-L-3-hydroxyproline dehydratase
MYGVIPVTPSHPEADLAVLFTHNAGYSTMCGHAVIALGRYAVDYGIVEKREPVTELSIECPCGLVRVQVEVSGSESGHVAFDSVPGFLVAGDVAVELEGLGPIKCDVAYGGAFYALADVAQFGLSPDSTPGALADAATALTNAVRSAVTLRHPEHEDLAFLYGSILTDGVAGPESESWNICVFADAEVDRSPTGSGVTARVAASVANGSLKVGERMTFRSITGSTFQGTALESGEQGCTVRVSGRAHYAGSATFWWEEGDEIGRGFLLT